MKRTLIECAAAMFAVAAVAETPTVYRLERDGDRTAIVGADGVKRDCVILDPTDYATMTGRVAAVWKAMNSTEAGRRDLHGNPSREVAEDGTVIYTYPDGYTHEEHPVRLTRKVRDKIRGTTTPAPVVESKPVHISARQWAMRKRVKAAQSGEVKTVTVEHDAVTGKDREIGGRLLGEKFTLPELFSDEDARKKFKESVVGEGGNAK